jgi:uncharacterized protein (DUF2147 family)
MPVARTLITQAAIVFAALAPAAWAQAPASPVGLWRNVDDKTGEAKAEIRIAEQGGVLVGRIERSLKAGAGTTCDACTDDRKDKPIAGLEIIRGAKKGEGDSWEGGRILDPENGKEYRLSMTPEGSTKLRVRGYIGPFFRTQTWTRVQ